MTIQTGFDNGLYSFRRQMAKKALSSKTPMATPTTTTPTTTTPTTTTPTTATPMETYVDNQAARAAAAAAGAAANQASTSASNRWEYQNRAQNNATQNASNAVQTQPRNTQMGNQNDMLKAPDAITEPGKVYEQRVLADITGNNPLVKNAQATEDTAAARRDYTARMELEQNLGQSHFKPGTAQYQRAMTMSRAGVNAANQAGQAGVNAFTRATTRDAMSAARDLEDQKYGNALGERTRKDMQAQDMASTLPEGRARYKYKEMIANGVSPQEAYRTVVSETGTINKQYQEADPGQNEVIGAQKKAEAWVQATTNLQPGTPEYTKAVRDRLIATDTSTQTPLNNGKTAADTEVARSLLANNKPLDDAQKELLVTSGDIPSFQNIEAMKTGSDATGLVGKMVKIGNEYVTVTKASRVRTGWRDRGLLPDWERFTDYTEIKDAQGNIKYIWDGQIHARPPKKDTQPKG